VTSALGMKMPTFPLSTMDRLIRKACNTRVSRSAALELNAVLEAIGKKISEEAIRLAKHRGAKTVMDIDIKAAIKLCELDKMR